MINKFSGDNEFLSNFYPCGIWMDGQFYPSVEHAFQAAKTLNIEDRKTIAVADTPALAKHMGKQVELRSDWNSVKCQIMLDLLRKKFSNNTLREKLLATGTKHLVEGNNHKDSFWGVYKGEGKNMLGQLLMQVRKEVSK